MEDKALLDLLGDISLQIQELSNRTDAKFEVLSSEITDMKSTLNSHSNSLRKIEVTQENITNHNISLLMESLSGTNEKVGRLDEMDATLQDVKSDVEVIKDVVTGHTHSIADLKAVK